MPQLPSFEIIINGWNRHSGLLKFLAVIASICYASELVDFSLHMDSELHALDYEPADDWIAQGRWGLYALNALLLPNAVMPVMPILIAIIGLVTGALFLVLSLSNKRGTADYLAAPIAFTCPILYYALYYTTISYGIGIGFAITCAGFFALSRATRSGVAIAIACFAFATGIYQAFLPLTVVLGGLWLAAHVMNRSITSTSIAWQHIAVFAAAVIASILLYTAVTKIILAWTGIEYASGYLSGFVTYSLSTAYIASALTQSLTTLLKIYGGDNSYYLYQLLSLRILFLLTIALVCWHLWRSESPRLLRLTGLLAVSVALAAPASLLMMNSGSMPPRVLFPAATTLAGLVFIALHSSSGFIRCVVALLAASCIYYFIVINNRFAYTNQMAWQADRELTVMIIERLDKLQQKMPVNPKQHRFPLEIVGVKAYPDIPTFEGRDMIGSSFYERSPSETTPRVTLLMRAMGNLDYRPANSDEKLSVVEQATKMPLWPHEGAVDIVKGVMVVKLSDYSPGQIPVQ